VVNHTDQELVYNVDQVSGYRLPVGDDVVQPGESVRAISRLGPGDAEVACDGSFSVDDESHGPTVRIVDSGHFYRPVSKLDCDGRARAWGTPVAPPQQPRRVPVLQLARDQIIGLVPTDQLSLAGYVHGGYRTVVVTRQGHVVMQVDYVRYPDEGWEYYAAYGCLNEGFDIRPVRDLGATGVHS